VQVPTLAGKVSMKVPPGANAGTTLRLKGKGVPDRRGGSAGDLYVKLRVVLPDKPPVVTVPETAVDYTLYGDSVYLLSEKKEEDGKTSLIATRTFVQTGKRLEGRADLRALLTPGAPDA
jgi:DnaJ-class molecular chaperone